MGSIESGEKGTLFKALTQMVLRLSNEFHRIPPDRKEVLMELARFVEEKVRAHQVADLNFICTHNSRRSHMAQVWAQAAAHYYRVPGITCFSGGTEATALNARAADTMKKVGFRVDRISEGQNPIYDIKFSNDRPGIRVFSKKYDHPSNPSRDFAAIMTCSHADANCPVVSGAAKRIAITYEDPKDYDGTPQEEDKYMDRTLEIGREMLFVFSQIGGQWM